MVNVSNIVIWPDYPRFPGPIFFNVTLDVNEELPHDKIEMDLEVSIPFQYPFFLVLRLLRTLESLSTCV